jgi:hypothetical protein
MISDDVSKNENARFVFEELRKKERIAARMKQEAPKVQK